MIWIGGLQLARKAVQSEQLPRVTDLAEVSERRKDAKGTRKRQAQLFETNRDFGGENRSRGGSENPDVARLVCLQEFPVNGDNIVDGGRKWILRGESIVDGHDFDLRQVGDGHAFNERSRIGVETSAVEIDQYALTI